jgi:hypothetical protein
MRDARTTADAIQAGREPRPLQPASTSGNHLQHDDLASLLLRPKCQHGDLGLLLRRRAYLQSPVFGTSELHNLEGRG